MSNRPFGVEIEHGNRTRFDELGYDRAYRYVAEKMVEDGFNVVRGGLGLRDGHVDYRHQYSIGYDGSGVEVRTRILQGDEGFAELERVFNLLNEIGGYTSRSDGMHIHLGSKNWTPEDYARLADTWVLQRRNIGCLVAPHRNGQNAYNPDRWTREDAARVRNGQRRSLGRADLNFDHWRRGHVEFRCHEGTLDYEKASNWIKFLQLLMDGVKRRKHPIGDPLKCEDLPTLLQRIRAPRDVADHCLRVANAQVLVAA